MPGTIVDNTAYTYYGEADLGTLLHGTLEALVAGRNVLGGDCTTLYLVNKLVVLHLAIFIGFDGLDVTGNTCILTGTASLLLVGEVEVCPLGNCLSVGNLGLANLDLCLVLSLHSLDVNIKMKLAHTLDDCLTGFRIDIGLEGRIFLGEAVESLCHIVCGLFVDRLDGKRDNRVGYEHTCH